jgi:threonine synthase
VCQRCINPACGATFAVDEVLTGCTKCGSLLDVKYEWDKLSVPDSLRHFEKKWQQRHDPLCFSGVWRFHELLPFTDPQHVVTVGEGQILAACSFSTRA